MRMDALTFGGASVNKTEGFFLGLVLSIPLWWLIFRAVGWV